MELRIQGVSKWFGGVAALDGVSLRIREAALVGVIGPNGSGKSTLFDIISGFLTPDGGDVFLGDERITNRPPHRIARSGLVRTFQVPAVARRLTVMDNLMFGAAGQRNEGLTAALFGRRRRDRVEAAALERASEVARLVGLHAKREDYAGNLSGGQLKLLSLGVAIMAQPRVLLLDEPTAGVNPALIEELIGPVFDDRPAGQTVVLVEHNMELVSSHCDEVYVLDTGRVIAHGSVEAVRRDRRVVEAYLGYEAAHT
jgi:ABC-type branched-subunit amino acid transport system ATPase component